MTDVAEQLALWRIREDGAGLAARSLARPAQAGWEDAAVPPERLGDYLREFEALLRERRLDGVPYGHFGDGCVHVRIDFELEDRDGRARYRRFVEDAADLVASYGGSMSGEHGDGRARSELLPRMYSPQALALMQQAKRILDPGNLLNPGVLVDPVPLDTDLRLAAAARPVRPVLRLAHDAGSFSTAVHRCTGVGKCVADNTATARGDVPVLPRHPRGEGLHARTCAGAPGRRERAASASTTRRWPTPWTCACRARAARATARPASTWRPTSPRHCPRSTPAGSVRARTTPWASSRAGRG